MKVPIRCVVSPSGGVRIETPAHVSTGTGAPLWINLIEVPAEQAAQFVSDFCNAAASGNPSISKP